MCSFYNFTADLNDDTWLQPGTIVLIKEPYLKYNLVCTNSLIRVDSPSDAIFVHETERAVLAKANALRWYKPEVMDFDQLKKRGNEAFVKKVF